MTKINLQDLTLGQLQELKSLFVGNAIPKAFPSAATYSPIPVVVCTDKRAVVFGWTLDPQADPITLTSARMALYWAKNVGGVFGLAENGPTKDSRISAVAPSVSLPGVTAVFSVDEKAVKAWTVANVQGR